MYNMCMDVYSEKIYPPPFNPAAPPPLQSLIAHIIL